MAGKVVDLDECRVVRNEAIIACLEGDEVVIRLCWQQWDGLRQRHSRSRGGRALVALSVDEARHLASSLRWAVAEARRLQADGDGGEAA